MSLTTLLHLYDRRKPFEHTLFLVSLDFLSSIWLILSTIVWFLLKDGANPFTRHDVIFNCEQTIKND